mmetsp:Transcript_54598/g.152353  ORF Transcript_54598/g.152353 Transcript_54598/m.152353 type:complete len:210 (-) Transcript_54598:1816-2445(-)
MKPRSVYSPGPSSYSCAGGPPPPPPPPPPATLSLPPSKAAIASSRPPACENSQSTARSTSFAHAFRAPFTCFSAKPMEHNVATLSGSAASPPPPPSPPPAAGNGSLMSGSSACLKYQFVAISAPPLFTAIQARLAAFSVMPMETSIATSISSGSVFAGSATAAAAALLSLSGNTTSPAWRPFPRMWSRFNLSGIGTLQSNLVGHHVSSK